MSQSGDKKIEGLFPFGPTPTLSSSSFLTVLSVFVFSQNYKQLHEEEGRTAGDKICKN